MANPSIGDDTTDLDERLNADENTSTFNLNMDGHNSENDSLDEDESLGEDENLGEDDMNADGHFRIDIDGHTTLHKVSERSRQILSDIEKVRQGVLEADVATENLKRKAEREAQLLAASEVKRMKRDVEDIRKERDALETANAKLQRKLILTDDRDFINETNKHLRLDLDKTKAQLRKEIAEKDDYHHIKEERTDFHLQLIKKTKECRDLEEKNAELQRKLDVEASFAAQAMAMFSKKPGI